MSATTATAAAAVSVMIASTCRLIAIAIVAVARAALVMMVMVAFLLALQAHVRDDHLRVVAHAVVIAAASVKKYLHQSVLLSLSVSLLSHLSRFSRERCMLSRRLSRERVMLGGSSVSLRRRALCELFFEADSCRFSHAWR